VGFWSTLADIGLGIAAPFTGGASLAGIPAVNGISQALSNTGQVAGTDAAAAAKGRLEQGQVQQGQDRNAISLYNDQFQNNLKAPSTLASQAARGDLLQNLQPAQISGLPSWITKPTLSGGLTPAALGPNARGAGAALSRNALLQLASNKFGLPSAPSLTPLPQARGYDQFAAGLGRAGAYAGGLSPLFQPTTGPHAPGFVAGNITNGDIPFDPEDPANITQGLDPSQWVGTFGG
jgi:hypothetical protein